MLTIPPVIGSYPAPQMCSSYWTSLSWTRSAPMLIHCRAGIGRSTAAGFIAACLHDAARPELDIAQALRSASSLARPNALMIQLADAAMGRAGRMIEVIRHTGQDLPWLLSVNENTPFELPSGLQRMVSLGGY
jgi:hypothetical protein